MVSTTRSEEQSQTAQVKGEVVLQDIPPYEDRQALLRLRHELGIHRPFPGSRSLLFLWSYAIRDDHRTRTPKSRLRQSTDGGTSGEDESDQRGRMVGPDEAGWSGDVMSWLAEDGIITGHELRTSYPNHHN